MFIIVSGTNSEVDGGRGSRVGPGTAVNETVLKFVCATTVADVDGSRSAGY